MRDWSSYLELAGAFFFGAGLVFWVIGGVLDITGTVLFNLWSARHFIWDAQLSFLASIAATAGAIWHKNKTR